jgi:hypothetical protein
MSLIDFPIERINKFLESHSFEIENPLGDGLNARITLTVKVKLTGVKPMILVGEWKNFIQYTVFLEDTNNEAGRTILNLIFETLKTNDYLISNTDTNFYLITSKLNHVLGDFLKLFGLDSYIICNRIVNNL